jgi:hypothetical protein
MRGPLRPAKARDAKKRNIRIPKTRRIAAGKKDKAEDSGEGNKRSTKPFFAARTHAGRNGSLGYQAHRHATLPFGPAFRPPA